MFRRPGRASVQVLDRAAFAATDLSHVCHHPCMSGALPEPIAQGDLQRTPFAHLLLYAKRHELTGSLVLWNPEVPEGEPQQDRIRFEGGEPVAAVLLVRASRLDRGMLPLFSRPRGPYAFYADVDLVGEAPPAQRGEVDLLPLIAASLRGSARDDAVEHVVGGFGDERLRLVAGFNLDDLGLMPKERGCLDLLRAEPASVNRLTELSQLEPKKVSRLIYLLAIAKGVEIWDGVATTTSPRRPRPPAAERPPAAPPAETPEPASTDSQPKPRRSLAPGAPDAAPEMPDGLSAELQARWREIESRAAAIENENFFEMLGVSREVTSDEVQKAYFALVKVWHPDRLPKPLAALRPMAERIFGYLTRGQETLLDEEERGRYISNVLAGGGTPEADRQLALIIQAAMEFRKVEILMRRREWAEALELVDQIIDLVDEEPDYHAIRGWALHQKSGGDAALRPAAIASLERALELAPAHDKAHYYLGVILKRAGQKAQALEHFEAAAKANPKNIEAVREVRIATMRKSESPAKQSGQSDKRSFMDKLFGGKK
ncbi:MAG TPA: tetratricopeptide repeat protein [Polyangiaceae bacterium]|nr:tetratricopeptide repeat protein [Polyangiaceae bacterium]